ncbi:MAG: hypothetical protein E7631_07065 [Ruminococcaceae bacterium]|nr:hypothetical protein [Oscillospiraceae bacterium]
MEFITYEMFGAVGDGVTDDMPAVILAHEEANRRSVPVKAKEGAVYYVSPKNYTAIVQTSVDWTGAKFIIDDRECENRNAALFMVTTKNEPVELFIPSLRRGQTKLDNPYGKELYVVVRNNNHKDYIRKGLNQNNGTARTDNFILRADSTLPSPVSFDFDEVTSVHAVPVDTERLTLTGGEFTTIANQWVSEYAYHARNIVVRRSNVEISGITHLITGELDHGAPYSGFLSISGCAHVCVHDCVFTGHKIYSTIGAAGKPVSMGSYDIGLGTASDVSLIRCRQTTDIHDRGYWGLIGTNFCRDLLLEDCVFSRFDAHQGVTNCTLRRCTLGWQCLNAIGNGTFLIEDTNAYGYALVNLRSDYGSTWNGDMIIRNCTWHPLGDNRAVFSGHNDGTHDFGYDCYLPQHVIIDGLHIGEENPDNRPLCIFNNYLGNAEIPAAERKYMPIPPVSVTVQNICTDRPVTLCDKPELMPETRFEIR